MARSHFEVYPGDYKGGAKFSAHAYYVEKTEDGGERYMYLDASGFGATPRDAVDRCANVIKKHIEQKEKRIEKLKEDVSMQKHFLDSEPDIVIINVEDEAAEDE